MGWKRRAGLVAALCCIIGGTLSTIRAMPAQASPTATVAKPSDVFPPDNSKWFALRVPGTHAVKGSTGVAAQIIELRGWLTFVGHDCAGQDPDVPVGQENTREPDWHYQLELDPAWLDHLGIKDPNTIILPGNVINAPDRTGEPGDTEGHETGPLATGAGWGLTARLIVHVEVASWDPSRHRGQRPPRGWKAIRLPGCNADVRWPYDPRNPTPGQPPLAVGQYVSMIGSLVTDEPHTTITTERADYSAQDRDRTGIRGNDDPVTLAVRVFWAQHDAETDPANPARWSELHPPDHIDVLSPTPRTEVVRAVLVATPSDLRTGATYTLDATLPLPTMPTPTTTTLHVVEIVGPVTVPKSLRGTLTPPFAGRATITASGVVLHISVVRQRGAALPSRFQAVYRISY